MIGRICCAAALAAPIAYYVVHRGGPDDASGTGDAAVVQASEGPPASTTEDPSRPLAADLAVEPVSMLVMFNRLHTPDRLAEALNRTPGQFSRVDIDRDRRFDPLSVKVKDDADGHDVEIHATPPAGEFIVATMVFDPEWEFLGHYNGLKGGGASTVGAPLLSTGVPAPLPIPAPPPPTPPQQSSTTTVHTPTQWPTARDRPAPTND